MNNAGVGLDPVRYDQGFSSDPMADLFCMSQTIEQIIKKPKNSRTNSDDPTLRLPHHILHSIFSYLTSQDLAHVRLVSKNWHRNTPSFFALNLDQSLFFKKIFPTAIIQSQFRNKYMDWVHTSLETSKSKLNKAEKRILRIYYDENINEIMRLIDGNNFHEVYLRFKDSLDYLPYMFRSTCFTLLHLSRCSIQPHIFHGEEKFNSLQELKLDNIMLVGETLSIFISKCPNIRELSLVNCMFLRSVVFPTKLDRLKKLYVELMSSCFSITKVQVIAPSLQVFHFVYRDQSHVVVNMDIRACRMLREFHLDCLKFPIGLDPEDFCSDFPRLETLLMGPCEASKAVKISSSSLRKLILFFTRMYEPSRNHVVFAPNLCTYEYVGTTFKPFLNPSAAPNLLETRIGLAYNVEKINRAWFLKLRTRLKHFSNNILLTLCIRDEKTTSSSLGKGGNLWSKLIGRASTHPLHHIKHVLLDMNKLKFQHEYLMKYIIDSLFWMSHPNTLTLLIPCKFVALANEVREELKSRKEGNCCSCTMDKCWSHFLKEFEVHEKKTSEKDKLKFVFKFTWQLIIS